MEIQEIEYLNQFEDNLHAELLKLCTSLGVLGGVLLASDDIDNRWKELAPEYMADAMPELASYPTAAIAWAGYVGMAVAEWWDNDWQSGAKMPYKALYGGQGFDDMDEHILRDILSIPLDSDEAKRTENALRSCAQLAITLIRREGIEAQTTKAFYIFSRTARALYRIGAALRLHALGYKFEKMEVPTDSLPN